MHGSTAVCLTHSLTWKLGIYGTARCCWVNASSGSSATASCISLRLPVAGGPWSSSVLCLPQFLDSFTSPIFWCRRTLFLHLSYLAPLVPSIAPATRILQNGPRMQAWLLKCRRFHCHLLFMGSWGNCGLERRSYYLPLVSTCVVRPYKKPN